MTTLVVITILYFIIGTFFIHGAIKLTESENKKLNTPNIIGIVLISILWPLSLLLGIIGLIIERFRS